MQGFLGILALTVILFGLAVGGTYIILKLHKEPAPATAGYNG